MVVPNARSWILPALAALALSGCAREQESLIVLHSPAWDGGCTVDGNNDVALTQGVLDVSFGTPYMMPAALFNQNVNQQPTVTNNRVDNGELQLSGADVQLRMPQAPEVIDDLEAQNEAFVEFTVDVPTLSLASGERQGVLVEVVSQAAAVALADSVEARLGANARPTLVVDTTFRALRSGNRRGKVGEIESRVYSFPIELCVGCLFTCATCEPDGTCPQNAAPGFTGGVCGNAQDFLVAPAVCTDPNE